MINSIKIIQYLLTVSLFSGGFARAQTVSNGWIIENIHGPSQVGIVDTIPVDINKDGLMDVVSASIEDGDLRAYINQGNLEFEQQYISTEIPGAFRVISTDFNSDGEIDFLIPSIETQEIIALIADSNAANFGYRKQIIANNVLLPTDAQAGDFNNDGLMDVVSISFEENVVLLHIQNDQGEFNTSLLSESPIGPRKLVVEDFNNDQFVDILLASSADNSIRLFSNLGKALFKESLISDQLMGIRSIAKCDLPNADYPDFVAGVTGADQVILFENNENDTFNLNIIDNNLPGADAVICAANDQGQELEIISISRIEGNIFSYDINNPLAKLLIANSRDGYITTEIINFENNSSNFVLTQAYFESRNLVYTLGHSNQEKVIWEDFPDGASSFDLGDINGDGINDIVVTSFRDDKVQWYDGLNNQHHVIAENIDGAAEVLVVDLDGDGNMDVLSAASFANSYYWHRNKGKASFETITIFDEALFANGLAVGDLNLDDQLDVVGTSGSDDSIRWFNRNGKKFDEYLIDDLNDAPNEVKLKDMNNDGNLDLIVPFTFSNDVFIYYNQGNGSFQSTQIINNVNRVDSIVISDLNFDGYKDLIISVSEDDSVLKLMLKKDGTFFAETITNKLNNPKKLFLIKSNESEYLLINHYEERNEAFSIFMINPMKQDSVTKPLYKFTNVSWNKNQVFYVKLFDLIFKNNFE